MRFKISVLVIATALFTQTYGQDDTCLTGYADITIAIDTKTPFVDFTFMKLYIKEFFTKIRLNSGDNGALVSILAYGVTTVEILPFTNQIDQLNTAIDTISTKTLTPSPQRQTHLPIQQMVARVNRTGVPRIAIMFVSGLTDGNYTTLKKAAWEAANEHNILFLTVSSHAKPTVRDLDVITNYVPDRIISVDQYKPSTASVFDLVSRVCRYMINGPVYFRNCTGKAHVVVGIDLQTEQRFKNALDFVSVLFWNVRQIQRTLLINSATPYDKMFNPGVDSASEFNTLFQTAGSRLNGGTYNPKSMLQRLELAYDVLPTSIHTVRVAVLITDKEPSSATDMSQAAASLRSKNIRVIIVSIKSSFAYAGPSNFSDLTDRSLQNYVVVSDFTLLGSGLNQLINVVCNAVEKCPGEIDFVVAMDSSYSITADQLLEVKSFTKFLTNSFQITSVHAAQMAVLAFGENVTHVSFFGDKPTETLEYINMYAPNKDDFKTNIDFAITNGTVLLIRFGRIDVPKVIIIVTDGKHTRGLANLQQAAIDAANANVITMAIGVGNGYVIEELRNITNGIQDNIIETDFTILATSAAKTAINKLCLFSVEGTSTNQVCSGKSQVSIAIEVSDINFGSVKQFVHSLISHLQVATDITVSIVIGSTGAVTNFPANTARTTIQNYILGATNADALVYDHVTTIQRLANTFPLKATMPRIAVLITDGKADVTASSAAARAASLKDIQFIALGVIRNNPASVSIDEIRNIANGIIQNRFVISEEGLLSTGINQITSSICYAIKEWTGSELMKYMGPAEITMMVDSCDSTMYNFYRAFTSSVLKYINVENNKVKFNAASFCSQIQPMTSYQDLYFIHPSLQYANIMAGKTWTASQIIGDYILHFSNIKSSYKFGIVMINDASFEPGLEMISKVAFQQGITLLPLGIDSNTGATNSAQLQAKLNLINKDRNLLVPSLNNVNVQGTAFLITNLANLASTGDRHIAMGLAGLISLTSLDIQFTTYNHVAETLQDQTRVFQGDIRSHMDSQIVNSGYTADGLAIHDAIANIRKQFAGIGGKKFAFIATNKPAEYPELVQRQRQLAESEGITIIAIGYRPGVTPDQLVAISGNPDNTWFYSDSTQIATQSAAKFIQLFTQWLPGDYPRLAFAVTGTGLPDDEFALVRHIVVTAANLYKQLGVGRNISLSSGIVGYDGYYQTIPLTDVQTLNEQYILNQNVRLQNEALYLSLMNMYLTLMKQKVPGRPQYAVIFYSGSVSNMANVKAITDLMRANGITVVPVHLGGVGFTSSPDYADAFVIAGNNSANVIWISKTTLDNNNVDHTAIAAYLKNDIMKMTGQNGNIDVYMGHTGDLDTIPLASVRKIIQTLIGTSEQYKSNLRLGVFEFNDKTLASLINFAYHSNYISLLDNLQTGSTVRINSPRTEISLEYIIHSLIQNKSSDVVKAGVLLVNDAAFSKYITSGLAYRAYANGIYMLPMRVITAGLTLTPQQMTEIAYNNTVHTFAADDVARLGTDGLVWLINTLDSLTVLVPSLTTTTTTVTAAPTTTATTTTTTTTTRTTTTAAVTTTTIKTSTINYNLTECVGPADIVFAMDCSDSVQYEDWAISKEFVNALIDSMLVGPNNIRIRSVFSFSTNVLNIFDDLYNKPLMKALLNAAPMEKVGTNTNLALEQIRLRLARPVQIPTNPKFGIIITDGKSASPSLTNAEAIAAANAGITLLVVGIRNSIFTQSEWQTMYDELLRIANNNPAHVIVVSNFAQMLQALPVMNSIICNLATTTQSVPTTTPVYSNICATKCSSTAITCLVPHPTNCKMYLECIREYGATYFFNYNIKWCGVQEFWNPSKGMCDRMDTFVCAADPCVLNKWPNGTTYAYPNNCIKYYKCLYSKDKTMVYTQQECECEYLEKYDPVTKKCIADTNKECIAYLTATTTMKLERCVKSIGSATNRYIENGVEKYCPVGQIFKMEMCKCDWGTFTTPMMTTTAAQSQGCSPTISLNFNTIAPDYYQFQGTGSVLISNGRANFDGLSFIANPQLNNNIAAPFIVTFTIKADPQGTIGYTAISLLKSCSGDPRSNIEMYIERATSKVVTQIKVVNPSGLETTKVINNTVNKFFENNDVTVTLGFNKNVISVETVQGTVKDLKKEVLPGTFEFSPCNGALDFGNRYADKGPFIGSISKWDIYNRCDTIPTKFSYLFA